MNKTRSKVMTIANRLVKQGLTRSTATFKAWIIVKANALRTKVKKEHAERFKQYAAEKGATSNAMLSRYVLDCIGENGDKPAPDGTEREENNQ